MPAFKKINASPLTMASAAASSRSSWVSLETSMQRTVATAACQLSKQTAPPLTMARAAASSRSSWVSLYTSMQRNSATAACQFSRKRLHHHSPWRVLLLLPAPLALGRQVLLHPEQCQSLTVRHPSLQDRHQHLHVHQQQYV
jgi:hypothetical protein